MSVIEFPTTKALYNNLQRGQNEIEDLFSSLDRVYQLLHKLEEMLDEKENTFNKTLYQYAHLVGVENVEVGFLAYARNVEINTETGDIRLLYEEEETED